MNTPTNIIDDDMPVLVCEGRPAGKGSAITGPSDLTEEERAAHARDMAILASDPRTSGGRNRPAWLVARVLREHGVEPNLRA